MIKKLIHIFMSLFLIMITQKIIANTGLFFNVSASGSPLETDITLCLNGKAPITCQKFHTFAQTLTIRTTTRNRSYPYVGIFVNTPGYTVANLGIACTLFQKTGYCLFSASDTNSKNFIITPIGSLPISPSSPVLPAATLHTPYFVNITGIGGAAPYSYAVTSGVLPSGLTLDPSTGTISGTPTQNGVYTFTITVTDSTGHSGSKIYTISVNGVLPVSPPVLPPATLNTPYTQTLTTSGGFPPYTYAVTVGTLPDGLSLSSSGVISGTPSRDDTYNFTVTVTDLIFNTGSQAYSLLVSGPLPIVPQTLPAGSLNTPYNQTISASGGVAPYTFSVTSGTLPIGLTLDSSTGVLSGTPATANTYNFTITAVDVNSNTGSQAYSLVISGPLPLSPSSLPAATRDTAYSQTISASGGVAPYTFSVTAGTLPTGLTLDSPTGILSGTPVTVGTFNFTITATDVNSNTGSQAYSIVVSGPLSLSPTTLPDAPKLNSYNQTITASAGMPPYTYNLTSGSLPPNLTLNSSTGVISGNVAGPPLDTSTIYTFTVTATDSNSNTGSQSYSINAYGLSLFSVVTTNDIPSATGYLFSIVWSGNAPGWTANSPINGSCTGVTGGGGGALVATYGFTGQTNTTWNPGNDGNTTIVGRCFRLCANISDTSSNCTNFVLVTGT